MRAPTWDERIRGKIQDFQSALAEQPLLKLIGKLNADTSNKWLEEENRKAVETARQKHPFDPNSVSAKIQSSLPMKMLNIYTDAFGSPTDPASWSGAGAGNAAIFPAAVARDLKNASRAKKVAQIAEVEGLSPLATARYQQVVNKLHDTHPRVMSAIGELGTDTKHIGEFYPSFADSPAEILKYNKKQARRKSPEFASIGSMDLHNSILEGNSYKNALGTGYHEAAHGAQFIGADALGQYDKFRKMFGNDYNGSLNPYEIGAMTTEKTELNRAMSGNKKQGSHVDNWVNTANKNIDRFELANSDYPVALKSDQMIRQFGKEVLPQWSERFGLTKNGERLVLDTTDPMHPFVKREKIPEGIPQDQYTGFMKREREGRLPMTGNVEGIAAPKKDESKGLTKYKPKTEDELLQQFEIDNPETRGQFWGPEQTKDPNKVLEGEVLPPALPNTRFNAVGQNLQDFVKYQRARQEGKIKPALIMPDGSAIHGGEYHEPLAKAAGIDLEKSGAKFGFITGDGTILDAQTMQPVQVKSVRNVAPPMANSNPVDRFQQMLRRSQGDAENYRPRAKGK